MTLGRFSARLPLAISAAMYEVLVLLSGPVSEDAPINGAPCTRGSLFVMPKGWQQHGKSVGEDAAQQRELAAVLRELVIGQLNGSY